MRKEYYIVEENAGKHTLTDLRITNISDVKVNERVRVVSGKKIPVGAEGIVLRTHINKYAKGKGVDPCVQIKLEDGNEVWTTGNNLITLEKSGISGIQEFENVIQAVEYLRDKKWQK